MHKCSDGVGLIGINPHWRGGLLPSAMSCDSITVQQYPSTPYLSDRSAPWL
jgi:hypothetical protein